MTTSVTLNEKLFDSLAKDALPKFGLNGWQAKLLQLSENITYLVQNGEAKVVLRISRPGYHPVEEIEAELIWVERIRRYCAVVVAEPLKGVNGEYIQYIRSPLAAAEYTCVLYKFLSGQAPDENDEKEILRSFYDLGEITAYLHRYTRDWSLAPTLKRFVWDYDTMLGRQPRWGRWQAAPELDMEQTAILERAAEIIQRKLKRYGQNRWNFGLIHADLRLANLLVDGITIKVIDFDDCGFGWFLHDLASAVSFIEHKPIAKHLIENWLVGYHRVLELEKKDLALIDTFILQRRLQLLAWLTSHSESTPVQALSVGYTDGSVRLAEEYLREQL
ncbi:serine/threonine protein kinase [Candidatus Termititenax aidoneus]|uniref:Serine/threonine protein kinase n=1 Tax=Termititenax aidoneus TaxID=2218524 RepID=A0A388TD23_TERA1|nr:serine/threonine protein kinase [Candidatus Termititenax aidoneus]